MGTGFQGRYGMSLASKRWCWLLRERLNHTRLSLKNPQTTAPHTPSEGACSRALRFEQMELVILGVRLSGVRHTSTRVDSWRRKAYELLVVRIERIFKPHVPCKMRVQLVLQDDRSERIPSYSHDLRHRHLLIKTAPNPRGIHLSNELARQDQSQVQRLTPAWNISKTIGGADQTGVHVGY
jgi:hypothetical protein